MAGDWIPMRLDLTDDPAVIEMADMLGEPEAHVVGYLHMIWSWASRNCHDGSVTGVTVDALARVTRSGQVPDAMVRVGWLAVGKRGNRSTLTFPKWNRWNSQSAKARALATNRKRESRHAAVPNTSRTKRDKSVTREEKRRVYKPPPPSSSETEAEPQKPEGGEEGEIWTEAEQRLRAAGLRDSRGALAGAERIGLDGQAVLAIVVEWEAARPRYDAGALHWRLTRGDWPSNGRDQNTLDPGAMEASREARRRKTQAILATGRGAGHDQEGLGHWQGIIKGAESVEENQAAPQIQQSGTSGQKEPPL